MTASFGHIERHYITPGPLTMRQTKYKTHCSLFRRLHGKCDGFTGGNRLVCDPTRLSKGGARRPALGHPGEIWVTRAVKERGKDIRAIVATDTRRRFVGRRTHKRSLGPHVADGSHSPCTPNLRIRLLAHDVFRHVARRPCGTLSRIPYADRPHARCVLPSALVLYWARSTM